MKERSIVFGDVIEDDNREDLRDKMLARLKQEFDMQVKDPARELERKRVEAALKAKQRL